MPVLKVKINGEWVNVTVGTNESDDVTPIPNPTINDEGKFLRVVNGVSAWATVPNAEEAIF